MHNNVNEAEEAANPEGFTTPVKQILASNLEVKEISNLNEDDIIDIEDSQQVLAPLTEVLEVML